MKPEEEHELHEAIEYAAGVIKEVAGETDRAAVVLIGAEIDRALRQVIEGRHRGQDSRSPFTELHHALKMTGV